MADYRFVTLWCLAAPIEGVHEALREPCRWPDWWPGLCRVEALPRGEGRRYRFLWRSRLGYRLRFEARVTRAEAPRLIEAEVRGDLEGLGRWTLDEAQGITRVRYLWRVRTTPRWMNLATPLVRPLFAWNHHAMMTAGAEGLARHLGVRLLAAGRV
ncbi:SRPBCC family protein [Halomonas salifodinae]|uniref:SRPBCC family protein n=1 Tax=Halomonas salifodinae TaxID=438745 RepID=A0ABW2EU98_9GAMM